MQEKQNLNEDEEGVCIGHSQNLIFRPDINRYSYYPLHKMHRLRRLPFIILAALLFVLSITDISAAKNIDPGTYDGVDIKEGDYIQSNPNETWEYQFNSDTTIYSPTW